MLRGLFKLTWVEIKIFVREPMGVIGTVGMPVAGLPAAGPAVSEEGRGLVPSCRPFVGTGLPIFATVLIALAPCCRSSPSSRSTAKAASSNACRRRRCGRRRS